MSPAALTSPSRLTLHLSERVLIDHGSEMAPVRLLCIGERAWLSSGVLVALVNIDGEAATVEVVEPVKTVQDSE